MTQLSWGEPGSRHYTIGVDRGVLYLQNGSGVPWNGLVSVTEAPSGSDVVNNYVDGKKFFARRTPEEFLATIEAFSYPLEFEEFNGLSNNGLTAQSRKPFGFSYRTHRGNDLNGVEDYLIHIVYNAMVLPPKSKYVSIADSNEPTIFSWDVASAPVEIDGYFGSHLIVDPKTAYDWVIEALENMLYGSETTKSHLPSPEELFELFEDASILRITDHGDGTWTAEGPDSIIQMLDPTTFQITWPSAVYLSSDTYRIRSL